MEGLIDFLAHMPFWYWFIFAGLLLIAEIMTGTTYLLWPAAAAALVGLLDMGPMDGMWEWQLAIFSIVTILLTLFATPYARDWIHNQPTDNEMLNQRGDRQIGKIVPAHSDFIDGHGKVKIHDTVWLAESDPSIEIKADDLLEVIAIEGATLKVVKKREEETE